MIGDRLSKRKEKESARASRKAAHEAQREERLRNRPLDSWDFMVAGVRYEGRPEIISEYANAGDPAFLARDRENKFSRNAVEVRLENGMQIGFVPEEDAIEVAPHLDAGHPHAAYIKKILTGGRSPIPVVVASVFRPDAVRSDLVFQHQMPPKTDYHHEPLPGSARMRASLAVVLVMLFMAAGVMVWIYSMLR